VHFLALFFVEQSASLLNLAASPSESNLALLVYIDYVLRHGVSYPDEAIAFDQSGRLHQYATPNKALEEGICQIPRPNQQEK
jgi:hypothetical protein